jgi:hypothetical protein
LRDDLVPDDLGAGRFLAALIERVLDRTPVDIHVDVREARAHRALDLEEAEEAGGGTE